VLNTADQSHAIPPYNCHVRASGNHDDDMSRVSLKVSFWAHGGPPTIASQDRDTISVKRVKASSLLLSLCLPVLFRKCSQKCLSNLNDPLLSKKLPVFLEKAESMLFQPKIQVSGFFPSRRFALSISGIAGISSVRCLRCFQRRSSAVAFNASSAPH